MRIFWLSGRAVAACVFCLLLAGIAIPAKAAAGAMDVQACDNEAANPGDPDRMAKGAKMDEIVPRRAILACEQAVKDYPDEMRFAYQLGRAYEAAGRMEDAMKQYVIASDKDYAMAYYNRALAAYQANDTAGYLKYLNIAAERGIASAKEELARATFSTEGFSGPEFFQAIYDGKMPAADNNTIMYMTTFIELFHNTDGCKELSSLPLLNAISLKARGAVFGSMLNNLSQGYQGGVAFSNSVALSAGNAETDATKFYTRYGCNTPVAQQFFANLARWVYSL